MLRIYLKTLVYSLTIFSLTLLSFESVTRTNWFETVTAPPSYGFNDAHYDIQLGLLAKYEDKYGQIDCIFLGSSQVFRGINPDIVSQVYEDETGESFHCFNMGHFGMWSYGAERLAKYIIAEYAPRYLIYGVSPIALNARSDFDDGLVNSDWIDYTYNDSNRKGWLIEHSSAYRTYLRYQNWLAPDNGTAMQDVENIKDSFSDNGHIPGNFTREDVNLPPNPRLDPNYPMALQLEAFKYFLDPSQHGSTQVILLGLPLQTDYPAEFPDKMNSYLDIIETEIRPADVLFWDAHSSPNFANELWVDRVHLNESGSIRLSYWVGMQMASWEQAGYPADFAAITVDMPPLEELVSQPFGLNSTHYQQYLNQAPNQFVDATLFMPELMSENVYNYQLNIGNYLDFHMPRIRARQNGYNIIHILNQTRTLDTLILDSEQQTALDEWSGNISPDILLDLGFDYLIFTNYWFDKLSADEQAILLDTTRYTLVTELSHLAITPDLMVLRPLSSQ